MGRVLMLADSVPGARDHSAAWFNAPPETIFRLSHNVVQKEQDENSVAKTFYIGQDAKVQALKTNQRLHEAIALLEKEFGLEQEK